MWHCESTTANRNLSSGSVVHLIGFVVVSVGFLSLTSSEAFGQRVNPFGPSYSSQYRYSPDVRNQIRINSALPDSTETRNPEDQIRVRSEGEGAHGVELLFIEHAWTEGERALRFDLDVVRGADAGEVDELEFEFEAFWNFPQFPNFGFFIETPVTHLNPDVDPNVSGVGDLEVGFRAQLIDREDQILSAGLGIRTRTGDANRGLGSGHVALEPGIFYYRQLDERTFFQTEILYEVALDQDEQEQEIRYDFGIGRTLEPAEDWRLFRNLTPVLEVLCRTSVAGDEAGETTVDMAPGLRWVLGNTRNVLGVGYRFPVAIHREFDGLFVVSLIHVFPTFSN